MPPTATLGEPHLFEHRKRENRKQNVFPQLQKSKGHNRTTHPRCLHFEIMVIPSRDNRRKLGRSRSLDVTIRNYSKNGGQKYMDDVWHDHSDGSQECVLSSRKAPIDKGVGCALSRRYQDRQVGQLRSTSRPVREMKDHGFGVCEGNDYVQGNGVIQRRMLRRRSFGGLEETGDTSDVEWIRPNHQEVGSSNDKYCPTIMSQIVDKLRGESYPCSITPLDDVNGSQSSEGSLPTGTETNLSPLASIIKNGSLPSIDGFVTLAKMKKNTPPGHLENSSWTSSNDWSYSVDGHQSIQNYVFRRNSVSSTRQKSSCGQEKMIGKMTEQRPRQGNGVKANQSVKDPKGQKIRQVSNINTTPSESFHFGETDHKSLGVQRRTDVPTLLPKSRQDRDNFGGANQCTKKQEYPTSRHLGDHSRRRVERSLSCRSETSCRQEGKSNENENGVDRFSRSKSYTSMESPASQNQQYDTVSTRSTGSGSRRRRSCHMLQSSVSTSSERNNKVERSSQEAMPTTKTTLQIQEELFMQWLKKENQKDVTLQSHIIESVQHVKQEVSSEQSNSKGFKDGSGRQGTTTLRDRREMRQLRRQASSGEAPQQRHMRILRQARTIDKMNAKEVCAFKETVSSKNQSESLVDKII